MSMSMSVSLRPSLRWTLIVALCGACSSPEPQRSGAGALSDSIGTAANAIDTGNAVGGTARAVDSTANAASAAALDSTALQERLGRLRSLQATAKDLAARDSLDIRVEVDLTARRVRIIDARSDTLAQHRVAIGSKEWPTQTGSWAISQVVLNPEWIPPKDESWAKNEKGSPPGAPDNPLGRAQLVYDLPRTIHGTNAPASIGKAVSHGSIRATNEAVLAMAQLLLQRTGVDSAAQILLEAKRDRRTKRVIDLPQLVPIRVF